MTDRIGAIPVFFRSKQWGNPGEDSSSAFTPSIFRACNASIDAQVFFELLIVSQSVEAIEQPFDVIGFIEQPRTAIRYRFSHLPDLTCYNCSARCHILIELERGVIEIPQRRIRHHCNIHEPEIAWDILVSDTAN